MVVFSILGMPMYFVCILFTILAITKAQEDGLYVNAYNDTFWMGDVLPQAEKK